MKAHADDHNTRKESFFAIAREADSLDSCRTAGQESEIANTLLQKMLADFPCNSLSTAKFADALDLQPQTIRKRYAQTGSYFGIVPYKLPNGKLRWPPDAINRLLGKEDAQ